MPHPLLPEPCLSRLRMLCLAGAPRRLMQLCIWVFLAGLVDCEIDAAEFFAGDMAITSNLQTLGFSAFPFELKLDGTGHDILSDSGFCFAMALMCKLRRGGLAWFGIVCSTWVFMSRASTGRHYSAPLGNLSEVVASANKMASRVVMLFWVAAAFGCLAILEQPASSLLFMHPRYQMLLHHVPTFLTKTFLGHFSAESPKLVHLYSNMPCVQDVLKLKTRSWLPMSEGVVTRSQSKDGREHVSGDAKLKDTQSYPNAFGLSVARMFQLNKPEIDKWALSLATRSSSVHIELDWIWSPIDDPWDDADLMGVFAVLHEIARSRGVVA